MPYIRPDMRRALDHTIEDLFLSNMNKGEVNYCITRLVHLWVLGKIEMMGKCYSVLSEGHSVLQDATAEYYRTVMATDENMKADENGPISELDGRKPDVE